MENVTIIKGDLRLTIEERNDEGFYLTLGSLRLHYRREWNNQDSWWLKTLVERSSEQKSGKYAFDIFSIFYDCDYIFIDKKIDDKLLLCRFEDEETCKKYFELFFEARQELARIINKFTETPEWRQELGFKYE